jgi:hypothetical protein
VHLEKEAQFWLSTQKKPSSGCVLKKKPNFGYEEEEARFCLCTQKKPNFGYEEEEEEARFWFCTQKSPNLGTKKKKKKKKPGFGFVLRKAQFWVRRR